MYDIPFDRSFLQLSNGIRQVTPSTDKPRINSKGFDGSERLTDDCVFQWVKYSNIHKFLIEEIRRELTEMGKRDWRIQSSRRDRGK